MEIKKWLGLKNTTAPERLKPGELAVAQNVDIDNTYKIASRTGQKLVQTGSYHSLWATDGTCYVMVGQDLKRMTLDGTLSTLTRLTSGRRVCFTESNGVVYFSNAVDTGRIVNGEVREWGIRQPIGQPRADPYPGMLPAGRYLYAMTFLREDGLESGTGPIGMIELDRPGGILLSSLEISTNPEVSGKIVYLSTANGTKLYRAGVLPRVATTHAYMNNGTDLTVALNTEFVEPAPAGHIVEIHSGIAYVVDGNVAWYSDAYSFERFRRAESRFLQLPGRISVFSAVGDGIFAATDKGTWFFAGHEPSDMKAVQVSSYGAIEGTAVKIDSDIMDDENTADQATAAVSPAVMWTSPFGIVVGKNGGEVVNLTFDKFGFPAAQRGAGVVRATRGFVQYVSTLQGTGAAPNIYE